MKHSVPCSPKAHITVVKTLLNEESKAPEGRTLVYTWVGVPSGDQASWMDAKDDFSMSPKAANSDTGVDDLSVELGLLSSICESYTA